MIRSSKKTNLSIKKSRGKKRSLRSECLGMIKDLKSFADCLIRELNAARENMFADMREEIKYLGLRQSKKTMRASNKSGIEAGMKLQNCSHGSMDRNVALDSYKLSKAVTEDVAYGQPPEPKRTSEPDRRAHGILGHSYNQAVSTPHMCVLSEPQSQNLRIRIPLNQCILTGVPVNNSGLKTEVATTLINDEKFHHQDRQYGSMFGVLGQNSSLAPVMGVDFPIHQSCSNNSILYNTKVGRKFSAVGNPTLPDRLFPNPNNVAHQTDGEFVSVRPSGSQKWPMLPEKSMLSGYQS